MAIVVVSDVESDVACKSGIPGNMTNSDNNEPDLSSLQHQKNKTNSELNELILDTNKARIIDRALGIYYKRMKINNYYNNSNNQSKKGKFLQYFEEREYEIDDIEEELLQVPGDKNGIYAAQNCTYLEFPLFDNFPMSKKWSDVNKQRVKRFKILQHCLEFGVPPLESHTISKNILIIHGYIKECLNNNNYKLIPIFEQCIFLFYVNTEIHWQKKMIYKERIHKILTRWEDWNKMDLISCIIPQFMWLGAEEHASDIKCLKTLGINYVLNCAGYDCEHVDYPKYFKTHCLFADDADDYNIIQSDIDSCIQFIHECIQNNGKILIHCFAGMNRSATVTIAALMYFKGIDLFQAVKYTQSRRGWILSNQSFQAQLIQYASDLDLLIE